MALILLVPILFPFVIALIAKRNASRTWVIPALVLELLLVIGCAFTRGSVVIPCIYGTQIVLDPVFRPVYRHVPSRGDLRI